MNDRGDLEELKKQASAKQEGLKLSTNDILVGLNWVLRCIVEEAPLPGQVLALFGQGSRQ